MAESKGYPAVAVNALIFDDDGRVLLTLRQDVDLWCLPGGMLEIGETVETGLQREVQEEIGCNVVVEGLTGVYSASNLKLTPPATRHIIVIACVCRIVEGQPGLSEEVADVGYFEVGALPQLVPNQRERIVHAVESRTEKPAVL